MVNHASSVAEPHLRATENQRRLISLEEIPQALIRARIAKGLTQKQLAEKVGLKEQQIQRYEATEYATATFSRIQEVTLALNLNIRKAVLWGAEGPRTIKQVLPCQRDERRQPGV